MSQQKLGRDELVELLQAVGACIVGGAAMALAFDARPPRAAAAAAD